LSASGSPVVSAGATVTLEGFDPATGGTMWTFKVGRDNELITEEALPPQVGASAIVLPNVSGQPTTLELATGASASFKAKAVAWCRSITVYKENVPYQTANQSMTRYEGDYAVFPCTSVTRPATPPARIPSFVGAHIGGVSAWAENKGVVARSTTHQ
jgi:hypothetical protein